MSDTPRYTPDQMRDDAEGCEREARTLDAEVAGSGTGHRRLAAMLRQGADAVERVKELEDEIADMALREEPGE